MKKYISQLISDLTVWAECPNGPCDKEKYKEGEYFFMGCGVFVSSENQETTMVSFHTLLGIILAEGKNNIGINGDQEIGLILMTNRITGEDKSEGVLVQGGKIAKIKGPDFISKWQPDFNSNYWFPLEGEIPAVSLEHIISVILYSDDLYETLIDAVEHFFLNITHDSDFVDGTMSTIKTLKENVSAYLKRDLH